MPRKRVLSNGGNVVTLDITAPIEDVPVCPFIIVPNDKLDDSEIFPAKDM